MFRCNAYQLPVVAIVYKLYSSIANSSDTLLSLIVYIPVVL